MFRTLSFTAVCLILASANSADAQKPFKNITALAAKKSYEEAIEKAKKEYAAKLDIAIKEAGGAGDVDDVNKLAAEKKRVDGSDPISIFRRRMIGTTWSDSPKTWSMRLVGKQVGRGNGGGLVRWFVTANQTLITQRADRPAIYVWHIGENSKSGKAYGYKRNGIVFNLKKIR